MSLKLYQLINSLSGAEKRYFKLHSQLVNSKQPKQYLKLFDLLDRMKAYDNDKLIDLLHKQGIYKNKIDAEKNYLYEFILQILSRFHIDNSGSLKVLHCLSTVEILYQKDLLAQAKIELNKARKIAHKYNLITYNLPILQWEQRLVGFTKNEQALEQHNFEITQSIKDFTDFTAYDFLYKKAHLFRQKISNVSNEKANELWDDFLQKNQLPNNNKPPQILHSTIRYYQIKAAKHYSTNELEKEFNTNKKILDLIQADSYFIDEHPEEYVAIFGRYLVLTKSVSLAIYLETLEAFKQIPFQLKKANQTLFAKIFTLFYGTELTRLIYANQFKAASVFLEDNYSKFKLHQKRIAPIYLIASYYRFTYINIAVGNFTRALKQVNKIAEMNKSLRPDIYRFAKLLSLLIHFELGNLEVIPYLKKSIVLYYKKQKDVFEIELLFLKYISKFTDAQLKNKSQSVFEKFNYLLVENLQSKNEQKALLYFDFKLWIDAKLKGVLMTASNE